MSLTKMKSQKKELLCHLQLILGVTNTTNSGVPSKKCPERVVEKGTVDIQENINFAHLNPWYRAMRQVEMRALFQISAFVLASLAVE